MNARAIPQHTRRAMTARDVDTVVGIEARAYSFPWTRGNFIDSLAAGYETEVLHVLDAGEVALVGYYVAMAGVDELHLLNITVAPDWQDLGLGSELLQSVRVLGRSLRLQHLFLEVRQGNHRARALYRRFGFAEVGVRPGYYPAANGREDAIVMRLALNPPGIC